MRSRVAPTIAGSSASGTRKRARDALPPRVPFSSESSRPSSSVSSAEANTGVHHAKRGVLGAAEAEGAADGARAGTRSVYGSGRAASGGFSGRLPSSARCKNRAPSPSCKRATADSIIARAAKQLDDPGFEPTPRPLRVDCTAQPLRARAPVVSANRAARAPRWATARGDDARLRHIEGLARPFCPNARAARRHAVEPSGRIAGGRGPATRVRRRGTSTPPRSRRAISARRLEGGRAGGSRCVPRTTIRSTPPARPEPRRNRVSAKCNRYQKKKKKKEKTKTEMEGKK